MTKASATATTTVGTLTDSDLRTLCSQGLLIVENYDPANVKQACYELRVSNIYYDLAIDKKYVLKDDQYVLIKPKQLIVIITMERLKLPADIVGRILTKGKLFSIGLLPVNTYADPGFIGYLGIVVYNLSNNYLKLKPGEALAKIEFSKLQSAVSEPYYGQHGYDTKIWPIPRELILSKEEIAQDHRVKSPSEEIMLSYGRDIGTVIDRVFRFERLLIFATIGYLTLSLAIIYAVQRTDWLSPITAIILGVVANVATTLLIHIATNIRGRG